MFWISPYNKANTIDIISKMWYYLNAKNYIIATLCNKGVFI